MNARAPRQRSRRCGAALLLLLLLLLVLTPGCSLIADEFLLLDRAAPTPAVDPDAPRPGLAAGS